MSLPSGVVTTYTYDELNRLDLMENTLGATTLSSYDYTVRKNGMRSKVVETRLEAAGNLTTRTIEYQYDRIGRLTREASSSNGDFAENYTWIYGYDRAGNRTVKWNDGTGSQRDYKYDANDWLRTETYSDFEASEQIVYGYDDNGSLIDRDRIYSTTGEFSGQPSHQLDEQQTYGYDLRNRLVSFDETELREEPDPNTSVFTPVRTTTTAATYGYDHTGIRTASNATMTVTDHMADPDTVTTTTDNKVFLVDGNNPTGYAQVLEEKGTPAASPTVTYVIGDDVIGQADGTGALIEAGRRVYANAAHSATLDFTQLPILNVAESQTFYAAAGRVHYTLDQHGQRTTNYYYDAIGNRPARRGHRCDEQPERVSGADEVRGRSARCRR